MAIETALAILAKKAQSLALLRAFLENELATLLKELGDQEYEAAIRALKDMAVSKDPSRELESALTCLRIAQRRFVGAMTEQSALAFLGEAFASTLTLGFKRPARLEAAGRAVEVSLLLAAGYFTLDDGHVADGFVEDCIRFFDEYAILEANHTRSAAGLGSPGMSFIQKREEEERLQAQRERLIALCDQLKKTSGPQNV